MKANLAFNKVRTFVQLQILYVYVYAGATCSLVYLSLNLQISLYKCFIVIKFFITV